MPNATDSDIRILRSKAARKDDTKTVALCNRALEHDDKARSKCATLIEKQRAEQSATA